MSDVPPASRGGQLELALRDLLAALPDVQAAAVVSFDGLPMASALPEDMNEDRVAAMSAALLSLGEKASLGLGRGDLSQVFVEGENGTVFLVSCESEAVLVAVATVGAKKGLVLYEVRRSAAHVGSILREGPDVEEQALWGTESAVESDVFAQALADAEAAYQAHRAEYPRLTEPPLSAPPLTDVNVVYTPSPGIPTLEPLTSEDVEPGSGAAWFDQSPHWDVR